MAISFILAFIYLLLSTLYVPRTITGSGDLKVYKIYLKTCPHVAHRERESKRSGGTISLEKGRVGEIYFTTGDISPDCWSVNRGEEGRMHNNG